MREVQVTYHFPKNWLKVPITDSFGFRILSQKKSKNLQLVPKQNEKSHVCHSLSNFEFEGLAFRVRILFLELGFRFWAEEC